MALLIVNFGDSMAGEQTLSLTKGKVCCPFCILFIAYAQECAIFKMELEYAFRLNAFVA